MKFIIHYKVNTETHILVHAISGLGLWTVGSTESTWVTIMYFELDKVYKFKYIIISYYDPLDSDWRTGEFK